MKAFEKWWNNILIEHGKTCVKNSWCSDEHYGQEQLTPYKVNYKQGWKAALEECKCQNKLRWNESEYLEQWIENELKED
jgi:hypothetical protein